MAITTINIGNVVNDGLGDDLRSAFQKVNSNFAELAIVANAITAVSITTPQTPSGYSVFKGLNGSTLSFKELNAGKNIIMTESSTAITISSTASVFSKVATTDSQFDSGLSPTIKFEGDDDIIVSLTQPIAGTINPPTPAIPGVVNIHSAISVSKILKSYNFGGLMSSEINNVFELYLASYAVDFGSVSSPNGITLDMGAIV